MFNIDFTGGTLVTIRLNENDPSVKTLLRVASGPSSCAQKASDPARRDRREPQASARTRASARFNIRTTEQDTEQVKKEILEAFGPTLARVEMTVERRQADRRRRAAGRPRRSRRPARPRPIRRAVASTS